MVYIKTNNYYNYNVYWNLSGIEGWIFRQIELLLAVGYLEYICLFSNYTYGNKCTYFLQSQRILSQKYYD